MKKIKILFLLAFLFAIVLAGCSESKTEVQPHEDGKLNVVATIFPQYDFARAVAREHANVTMLISPGGSVHSFDPSPADVMRIQNADVFIYIGGESDVWVDRILDSMDAPQMRKVRLMDYVQVVNEARELEEHGDEEPQDSEYDEHIWTSPQNAIAMVRAIEEALCQADSENAQAYRENAQSYIGELEALDEEFQKIADHAKRNTIVVADRFPFRYFVDAYGFDHVAAFSGCNDQSEVSARTIVRMVETVQTEHIPFVYYVELSNQAVAKTISEQTGSQMLLLHSCQNVSKQEFDAGVTYLSLMSQNAENLKEGLNEPWE